MSRNIDDYRRWMAFHSVGAYELLLDIHGSIEDMRGAIEQNRREVAVLAVRDVVLRGLGVLAIRTGGGCPTVSDPFSDPFAGLPAARTSPALALIGRCADPEVGSAELLADTERFVRGLEQELGFAEPPPSVRTADGLFPAIRIARDLLPLNQRSGYRLALPSEWMPQA